MELEALQQIYGEVTGLGAQIVVLTPELERYTRALHKKLNLTFDILTDLHLKTAEEFRLVFTLQDYLRDLYKSFGNARTGFMMNLSTDCQYPHDTWSTSRGLSELPM
jgi:peroxiredoxin